MRKSIFDIEIRMDLNHEFENLKSILFEKDAIFYQGYGHTLYEILDEEVFPVWKYKGVMIDLDDFCDRLNINLDYDYCTEEEFLVLVELLINLWIIVEDKIIPESEVYDSKRVLGYMRNSLPLIVEKMNYKIVCEEDKYRLVKRDSDTDSILDIVPSDCARLLLDYNDIRNDSIESKKTILKRLDLYIEKNKKEYQNIDKDTYNSIQTIVNNMGVNHPIKEKPYNTFNNEEIASWYDKCFKLIIHLIRTKEVNEINKERKKFAKDVE